LIFFLFNRIHFKSFFWISIIFIINWNICKYIFYLFICFIFLLNLSILFFNRIYLKSIFTLPFLFDVLWDSAKYICNILTLIILGICYSNFVVILFIMFKFKIFRICRIWEIIKTSTNLFPIFLLCILRFLNISFIPRFRNLNVEIIFIIGFLLFFNWFFFRFLVNWRSHWFFNLYLFSAVLFYFFFFQFFLLCFFNWWYFFIIHLFLFYFLNWWFYFR